MKTLSNRFANGAGRKRLVLALSVLALTGLLAQSALAAFPSVAGTYAMSHDGWHGTLVINQPTIEQVQFAGACQFHALLLTGTYRGPDGIVRRISGKLGGFDPNRRDGSACPQSNHLITFTIDFTNGEPPQQFSGYFFTQDGRGMAGTTFWRGMPFGWDAAR